MTDTKVKGSEPNGPVAVVEALVTTVLSVLVVTGMITELVAVEIGGAILALVTATIPFVHWAVTRQWTYSAARVQNEFLDAETTLTSDGSGFTLAPVMPDEVEESLPAEEIVP